MRNVSDTVHGRRAGSPRPRAVRPGEAKRDHDLRLAFKEQRADAGHLRRNDDMPEPTPEPKAEPLRLGIIGLGRAFTLMLPTLSRHPLVRLAAAFDPRADARARFAEEFGGHE